MAEETTTDSNGIPIEDAGAARAKVTNQMAKLRDANTKYKNLLKMAKERIQAQEEELEALRAEANELREKVEAQAEEIASGSLAGDTSDQGGESGENSTAIVRVLQRLKLQQETESLDASQQNREEIWALVEFEVFNPDLPETTAPPRRYQKWRRFYSENELSDFIRRDTGEPLTLPPYSLSPQQSAQIEEEAKRSVAQVSEEFRRFRVRSELARKQADAQIRDLQSTNVISAKRRIEGPDVEEQLEKARSEHGEIERLKAAMSEQESRWKEAYDVLLVENEALKSSGSEALLASQWRQRYETCFAEKEDLESKLKMEFDKAEAAADAQRKADAGKYEMKYRDLKESFRLYRKKAKEIFEAQQRGDMELLNVSERGGEQSKLSYLKNLMVNYLSSDAAIREHMEGAIGTVLQFTPEEIARIEKKKADNEAWF